MNFDFKKLIPYVAAFVIFYGVIAVYFSPFFDGYTLPQSDVQHWEGMAKEVKDHRYSESEDPKWTNSMFGGMPAYQITNQDTSNKLNWVNKIFQVKLKGGMWNLLVAFCGFYILLVLMGVNPWLSIVGGLAFGLSTYNIIILVAGHNTKLGAIGWMPAVLGAVIFIYRNDKKEILGLFLLALFMGLELLANHVQITYYLGGLVGIVIIQRLIEAAINSQWAAFLRKTGIVLIAMLIGVMCNFGMLFNTYKYAKTTIRGKSELIAQVDKDKEKVAKETKGRDGLDWDYITRWSLGTEEIASVFLANVKGGASGALISSIEDMKGNRRLKDAVIKNYQSGDRSKLVKSYWGDQPFTSGPVYMGITVFLLFIVGLVVDKKGYFRWTAIAGVIIFTMLALGRNFESFNRWMLDVLPMYNKFRAPSMTMVIVQLLLPLVGVWGIHQLIKRKDTVSKKWLYGSISSLASLLLLFLIKPEMWFTFFSGAEEAMINQPKQDPAYVSLMDLVKDYRIDLFKDEVKRALFYVVLLGGTIIAFIKMKFDPKILIIAVGAFVVTDLWTADTQIQNNEKVSEKSKDYKHWKKKKKKKGPYKASKSDKIIAQQEFRLNPSYNTKYLEATNKLKNYKKEEGLKTGLKDYEKDELKFKVIKDNSHYRVLKMGDPFNDAGVSYFHKSIGGYHAAKLMRYQELIENVISKEMGRIQMSFGTQDFNMIQNSMANTPVLNMLNMKYVIYNPEAQPLLNGYANGAVWPIKDIVFVKNPNEEIEKVGVINTKTQALVDKRFKEQLASATNFGKDTAIVQLLGVKSNELNYNFQSQGDQVLIFSDIYYADGWNAYIDDKPVDHFRANYVLRGLQVPAGKHSITFKFEPSSVSIGMLINTIFSLLVLAGLGFFGYKEFKKNASEEIVDAA